MKEKNNISTNFIQSMILDFRDGIEVASRHVRDGGVIIYPTDTVYGIGCDPYNKHAVNRIYEIKGREKGKPLPLLFSSIEHVKRVGRLMEDEEKLIDRFWPGALTLIIELSDDRLDDTLEISDRVGVRIPANSLTLRLIEMCNGVLVGTSANISGKKSAKSIEEIDKNVLDAVEIVLDGGVTVGIESSIVDLRARRIIREGYIKRRDIEKVLGYELDSNNI